MKLIDLVTKEGDFVLDPFTGTGSTLVACHRSGRRFIGIELNPRYAEQAVRTWQREVRKAEADAHAVVHRDFIGGPLRYDDTKPGFVSDLYIGEDGDYHYRSDESSSTG
jgi:tRNA G37 N-methylase Trm5